jgi:hypothetical protein
VFIADEAARRRLDSMHQRLRLLEQQMGSAKPTAARTPHTSSLLVLLVIILMRDDGERSYRMMIRWTLLLYLHSL